MDIKGFCAYDRRCAEGVSPEFAVSYVDQIRQQFDADYEGIVWERVEAAGRYTYNFKIVLVLKETSDSENDRREAYRAQDIISKFLGDSNVSINGKKCFVAVQASPATHYRSG